MLDVAMKMEIFPCLLKGNKVSHKGSHSGPFTVPNTGIHFQAERGGMVIVPMVKIKVGS